MPRPIVVYNNFKRVLDIIRFKINHLKCEIKWVSSGSLDSNEQGIEGLKAAQRNELVFPGQNTIFPQREGVPECWQLRNEAYISGLGRPEALKAFCGKITKHIPGVNYTHDNDFIWL